MQRSFWSTIRGKLLARTLFVVLVPVLVIAGVAIASLQSLSNTADDSLTDARSTLSEEVVGSRVASVADQIARELAIFLDERVADTELWATDVGLATAAKGAAGRAAAMGLQDQTIEQIEARFQDEPRLNDVHVERDLLKFVASTPAFKEIFLTDVNGYNVDYSNRTSDFVQSDEGWWERAMTTGLDISEPEFDASAEVFAVNIAIRLEDEGKPVGVLKAALDMNVVQIITDRFADGIDGYDIAIVDNAGRFLAETSSGHSDDHIMNLNFLASDSAVSTPLVREVFAPNASELHADGFSLSDDGVAGFAHVDQALSSLRSERGTQLNGFGWTVIVEQPAAIAFSALTPLEGLAGEVSSTSSRLTALLVLVALAGSLAAAYMALVFARKITSPIAQLRDAANKAAEITLPNVVAQIDALQPGEELPELEFLSLDTGDEVEDLAQSFNTVQQTAADLASEQARMRRTNVSTTFVNLGRRNQNLLSRQLEHINSMEGNETNPETLQRLFQLDHLATRMRRNAESLLVLAGEDTPRRFRKPVSMHQLLQAAGGETEDFSRIELTSLDEAFVEGGAASNVAHLLAELLENASSFSPPGSPIQVHGRRRENSYLLAIVDQGIGMEEADLEAANAHLDDPAAFDRAPSAYLGHFVVGHLAKRHGIRVRLADSPYGGLTAQLMLPGKILASIDPTAPTAPKAPVRAPVTAPAMDIAAPPTDSDAAKIAELELALLAHLPEDARPLSPDPVAAFPPSESEQVPAPAPAPVPAAVSAEMITEQAEFAVVAAVAAEAPATSAEDAGIAETTPSGFRRRRRGQEGAPEAVDAAVQEQRAATTRRSPEEVRSSLQRFREGVDSGRAQSSNPTNSVDHNPLQGDSQ